jgi:hypothetical protein
LGRCSCTFLSACLLGGLASAATAHEIELRAYANAPVGFNFVALAYAWTQGGVGFNPSLPITEPKLNTSSAVVAYARALDVWGLSSKLDVVPPFTWLSGSALYKGDLVERNVDGLGNPSMRFSMNFYGASALSMKDYVGYQQDLIVGASLRVWAPWSQYDETRLVNIGTNRWSFKPELGASKAFGPWIAEFQTGITFFTVNDDFFNGKRVEQEPLYSAQVHLIYNFRSGIWASVDTTYYTGGGTTVNDAVNNDLQRNWRGGATLSFPLDRQSSVKLYASSGVSARTSNSFDLIGVAYQYRWAGGS